MSAFWNRRGELPAVGDLPQSPMESVPPSGDPSIDMVGAQRAADEFGAEEVEAPRDAEDVAAFLRQ